MIINNQTPNPAFSGAFRIKPNEIVAKTEIPKLFTHGRQIFHDILEQGDEFIVLRNSYDKRVAKYIEEHNLKGIEYYPEIDTCCRLDEEKPSGLLEILKNKPLQIITDFDKILSVIKLQKKRPKSNFVEKEIEKVTNALRLNIEAPKVLRNGDVLTVRDEGKKRTMEIVIQNKGMLYVHVKPDSLHEDSIKCIINGKGQIVKKFDSPKEIMKFAKVFKKLKNEKSNLSTET